MRYRYYLTQRPPMPGAFPEKNLLDLESFDDRTFIPEIDRMAWGYVEYEQELTAEEIAGYELTST